MGVEVRIVEAGTTDELPWDDVATGELQVRGSTTALDYYKPDAGVELATPDGWMKTGDVAAIDATGSVRIADRTKDLIKSGGEWISSVDLENAIMSHPKVKEAAVIGIPDPKWDERPLACVVVVEGEELTADEVIEHITPMVAKWWLPSARGVHRRGAQDQRRQVLQEGPAHPVRRLPALSGTGSRRRPSALRPPPLPGDLVPPGSSPGAGRPTSGG